MSALIRRFATGDYSAFEFFGFELDHNPAGKINLAPFREKLFAFTMAARAAGKFGVLHRIGSA